MTVIVLHLVLGSFAVVLHGGLRLICFVGQLPVAYLENKTYKANCRLLQDS